MKPEASSPPHCRVCGSDAVRLLGSVEYFSGYSWEVRECDACGCRYTQHDNRIYDVLHSSGAIDYYNDYKQLAATTKEIFDRGDPAALKDHLSHSTKYRFIIAEVDAAPPGARILEVGCSRGYLTAYFILSGQRILGTDVSGEAIRSATRDFGPHFALADDAAVAAGGPYDVIYHVGMIGCVSDPIGFTNGLLAMLKPGGKLLFNAPNLGACWMKGQVWFNSAPPPDLVTLYPPRFWAQRFAPLADVRLGIEQLGVDQSFVIGLRRLFGRPWRIPPPQEIQAPAHQPTVGERYSGHLWGLFERAVGKIARITRLSKLVERWPTEFGLYVIARRR